MSHHIRANESILYSASFQPLAIFQCWIHRAQCASGCNILTSVKPSHDSRVPVKIAGPETETGNRYVGRKTKERLRGKQETGGKLALACSRCAGGLARTVGGCLGYGIGYSIPRVEISPGLYKNFFAKIFGYWTEYLWINTKPAQGPKALGMHGAVRACSWTVKDRSTWCPCSAVR